MRAGRREVSGGTGSHFSQFLQPGDPYGGKMAEEKGMMRDVARDAEKDIVAGTKVSLLWFGMGNAQRSR